MSSSPRIVARRSARALIHNFKLLRGLCPSLELLPMIKADGYGHGATWAARTLLGQTGLAGFGVATLDEAQVLRAELEGPQAAQTRILVFSGALPWRDEYGALCESHGLTPVIGTLADLKALLATPKTGRFNYHLKFNTGMNRLGIAMHELAAAVSLLKHAGPKSYPEGILSHLSRSETPRHPDSQKQLRAFETLRKELRFLGEKTRFHLANSGGIIFSDTWRLPELTHWGRPGLALYGVPPKPGPNKLGLEVVQSIFAKILSVHRLKRGDKVGYGGTFTATKPLSVAIVAAGYADGIPRSLSGRGRVFVNGRSEPIVGMVSMDLCAVECAASTRAGDYVEILGHHVTAWEQARAARTIPYELLTGLAVRERRVEQLDDPT